MGELMRRAVAAALLVAAGLTAGGGCAANHVSEDTGDSPQLVSPNVRLWDARKAFPDKFIGDYPCLFLSLVSLQGEPQFRDIESHLVTAGDLVSIMRRDIQGAGQDGRAVYAIRVRNFDSLTVAHLAKAVHVFRLAAKESGHPERITLILEIPGVDTGVFREMP